MKRPKELPQFDKIPRPPNGYYSAYKLMAMAEQIHDLVVCVRYLMAKDKQFDDVKEENCIH